MGLEQSGPGERNAVFAIYGEFLTFLVSNSGTIQNELNNIQFK